MDVGVGVKGGGRIFSARKEEGCRMYGIELTMNWNEKKKTGKEARGSRRVTPRSWEEGRGMRDQGYRSLTVENWSFGEISTLQGQQELKSDSVLCPDNPLISLVK